MKTLRLSLVALVFGATLSAASVSITATVPLQQFATLETYRLLQFAQPQPSLTLAAPALAIDATVTLSAVPAGWSTGLFANIPATCTQGTSQNFALNLYFATDNGNVYHCPATNKWAQFASGIKIEGEAMIVTGFAGNVLTVTRGTGGTTAAAHASGATVNVLQFATMVQLAKQVLRDGIAALLIANQDPAVVSAQATATSSQAAVSNTAQAGLQ